MKKNKNKKTKEVEIKNPLNYNGMDDFESAEKLDENLTKEVERLERKNKRRSKIYSYIVSQVILFILVGFVIIQTSNLFVKKDDYNNHYGITVNYTNSKDKSAVEKKVKEIKDLSFIGIDKVGIFDKQYKLKFEKEPTDSDRAKLETSLKQLAEKKKDEKGKETEEKVTLDDTYQYNRMALSANLKDYSIYIILIIVTTLLAGYFIRWVEELLSENNDD